MTANGTQEKQPKQVFFKEIARPGKMAVSTPAVFTSKLACPHDRPKRPVAREARSTILYHQENVVTGACAAAHL
jgi:hypothetical protein